MNCRRFCNFRMDIMRLLASFTVILLTLSITSISALTDTDPLGCSITWTSEDQSVALNGALLQDIKSAEDCQQYCINRPHCIAVEFDYSSREDTHGCWIHENVNDLQELYNGINVTHYDIHSSCPERRNGAYPSQVVSGCPLGDKWISRSGLSVAILTSVCVMMMNNFEL